MSITVDYLVVGSGLTGATIARHLADRGREVLVLERRAHVGGNAHDTLHPSGVRIHTYGPHFFRTNSARLWDYVQRFGEFFKYEAVVKSLVQGQLENWPIAASYVRRVAVEDWQVAPNGAPANFEEACLAQLPRIVYERFIKGYSEKQWGVPPAAMSADLFKRIAVRTNDDPRLVQHRYQGIPRAGYAAWMKQMLHDIPAQLETDYLRARDEYHARRKLIFTGPIDEFFDFELGRLKYRGQQREHIYLPTTNYALPYAQINNPDPAQGAHIRTLEWKHMMPRAEAENVSGTVLTRETTITPLDPGAYEYPFPDAANAALYKQYQCRARAESRVMICGRLGEYRYYDMDQAIGRALVLAQRITEKNG
jgi:UDP-galactopyranose mutase